MTEPMVTVRLRHSVGLRGGPLYGPGIVQVPASFARALGLEPVEEPKEEVAGGAQVAPLEPSGSEPAGGAPQGSAEGEPPAEGSGAQAASDLPEDFPGREALIEAGYTTLDAVRAIDFEQTKVPGVGKATIAKIAAYFAAEV